MAYSLPTKVTPLPTQTSFCKQLLKEYSDSTYWPITHSWKGENSAKEVLAPHLKPKNVALSDKIKPTAWDEMKTDGLDIDLNKDSNQLKAILDLL